LAAEGQSHLVPLPHPMNHPPFPLDVCGKFHLQLACDEPSQNHVPVGEIDDYIYLFHPFPRNRNAFPTTVTDDKAISPPAIAGCNMPRAASGSARLL